MNLKVGAHVRLETPEKIVLFVAVPLHFFGSIQAQLVVLMSVIVMASTVWPVSCLLFFYSRCSPRSAICKSGGTWWGPTEGASWPILSEPLWRSFSVPRPTIKIFPIRSASSNQRNVPWVKLSAYARGFRLFWSTGLELPLDSPLSRDVLGDVLRHSCFLVVIVSPATLRLLRHMSLLKLFWVCEHKAVGR